MCKKLLQAYCLKTPTIHHLSHFFRSICEFHLELYVAVFIDGLDGPHLFWSSPGMNEWLRWLRFSLHMPFTLDSSKCDLRIPIEPAPMTSTYQASACLKCGDVSVIKVSQMAKQWLTWGLYKDMEIRNCDSLVSIKVTVYHPEV